MTAPDFTDWSNLPADRPHIMGILNVTPDSFSDGGRWLDPDRAAEPLEERGPGEPRFPRERGHRPALRRPVVHEPQLVLADEPTGNLDADTARQVLSLLRRTCERRMTTLVMATHSTDVAAQATRVIAIQGGHIVERTI